jgi:hypothetical protein
MSKLADSTGQCCPRHSPTAKMTWEKEMRKRKLKKSVTLAFVNATGPHDRRATEVPINAKVAAAVADDPYEPGAKITVLRSLRDDPLAAMHNAKQIDQAQFIAGRHWQRAFELTSVGGVRAVDLTRERVDGGGIPQPTLSDAQVRAFADLKRAMSALGLEGESLVKDFLGRGLTLRDIGARRGVRGERARGYIGWRLRECLDTLAVEFGYAGRTK